MTDREKAEFLFEEIGELDETVLYECMEIYPAARKRKRTFRMFVLAAAALTLSVSLLLSSLLLSAFAIPKLLGQFSSKGSMPSQPDHGENLQPDVGKIPPVAFDPNGQFTAPDRFSGISKSDEEQFLSEEQVGELLFSDRPSVICGSEACKGYEYAYLTAEEFNLISDCMKTPKRKTGDSMQIDVKVWICDGRGKVMSPYLEKTKGNMGYGALFDYEQEVVPDENLLGILENRFPSIPFS